MNTAVSASEAPEKAPCWFDFYITAEEHYPNQNFKSFKNKVLQLGKKICVYNSGLQGEKGRRAQMTFQLQKNDLNQITCSISNTLKTALQRA